MIFGHIFGKDPIDIHEQIYGTPNLSMYRSYPQSDFSVTFFSKELSHKINCPVRDDIFRTVGHSVSTQPILAKVPRCPSPILPKKFLKLLWLV